MILPLPGIIPLHSLCISALQYWKLGAAAIALNPDSERKPTDIINTEAIFTLCISTPPSRPHVD
jgi:hypothetical protein